MDGKSIKSNLSGKRILVTRAKHQASLLSDKLRSLGAQAIEIPVIEIGPPASWQPLDEAISRLYEYNWILFASANAVETFFNRLKEYGQSVKELQDIKIAAIGPATAEVLVSYGAKTAFCPSEFIAESLVDQFPDYPNMAGFQILWPRTNVGRDYIINKFQEAGATVEVVPAYQTKDPSDMNGVALQINKLLEEKKLDVITLTSSQCAKNLGKLLQMAVAGKTTKKPADLIASMLQDVKIATIGPETTAAAKQNIGKVDIEAKHYTMDGLVEAICQ